MPKVTIWIRKEDLAKWKAIESKPEFIHDALNSLNGVATFKGIPLDTPEGQALEKAHFDFLDKKKGTRK